MCPLAIYHHNVFSQGVFFCCTRFGDDRVFEFGILEKLADIPEGDESCRGRGYDNDRMGLT